MSKIDYNKHVIKRLKMLEKLDKDHGGEDEAEPCLESFGYAYAFLDTVDKKDKFMTGITHDEGLVVFEFHGTKAFADFLFHDDGTVDVYYSFKGAPSELGTFNYLDEELRLYFNEFVKFK